jgi:hypothetical protein
MRAVSLIAITVLFFSCKNDTCREVPGITEEKVMINIERMEKSLFDAEDKEEIIQFLSRNEAISVGLFHSDQYPDINILSERIFKLINDPYIDTLYNESIESFNSYEENFRSEMELAFARLNYYYPNSNVPEFQTVVSGLYNDVYITDSLIVLGIDFFIGEDASYRPLDMPQYILKRYSSEYLVPTLLKYYLDPMVQTGNESTLLSEMIDYGKLFYFISRILPCTEDWRIMGYTPEEMQSSERNQEIIWANFVENEVLYETSEETKRRFIGERPNVYEIGEACPGRIGTWIGWEIVEAYAVQTNATLQEIMAEKDHHKIFSKSGYKPKNK